MNLESLIREAAQHGASDLHVEPGMPPALRVRGQLRASGEPVPAETAAAMAEDLLGADGWRRFRRRHSADLARSVAGVRCRVNVLQSARGIGLAVRLLATSVPTIERLNLHPDLADLARLPDGLILVAGPTGSGKSSTIAGLVDAVNTGEPRHVVTLEHPIEFVFRPQRALIRQREVGRDTPSFQRGLLDAMREDPDVLVVGEMREAATMRLTINAAETGHLVLSTVHSATAEEALHRITSAFSPEVRAMVCAQLADCLRAVICQRLTHRPDLGIRVPECEILINTQPTKALIRQGQFFKLPTILQTGAADGQYTRERYRAWLASRAEFHVPRRDRTHSGEPTEPAVEIPPAPRPEPARPEPNAPAPDDVIVIQAPTESIEDILDELQA